MKSLKGRSKNDYLNFKTLFTKEVKTKFIQVHLIEEVMLSQLGHICLFNDYGTLIFLYSSTHNIDRSSHYLPLCRNYLIPYLYSVNH